MNAKNLHHPDAAELDLSAVLDALSDPTRRQILVLLAEILALIVGVAIGVYSAIRQYSIFDYAATTFSFLGFAMPVFWLALMLQILFTNIFIKWHVRIF